MSPRGTRPAVQGPAFLAGGETATISLPPVSAPSPAYCISLVSTAATAQANRDGLGLHPPTPTRARRAHHLPVGEQLASLPGGPTGHGYTGSATQASSVQPRRPPPGASSAAAAVAATAGPSHWTAAGDMGSAHATTTSATSTNTASATAAPAAALATPATCTGGDGLPFPSASSVRMLLNTAAHHMGLDRGIRVVPLPATHHRPQRIYELRAAPAPGDRGRGRGRGCGCGCGCGCGAHDGMLVLVLAPPSMLRLLRSEQWIIKSEAAVVRWIRGVLLAGGAAAPPRGPGRQHRQVEVRGGPSPGDAGLLRLLPALVGHSQSGGELGSAYNILSHLSGLSLSCLPRGLTPPERRHVDFQAGRLVRRLSLLRSPSGRFGPAVSVLCPAAVARGRAGGSTEEPPGGADRWSLAFHAILEGVLRDAEDMAVTISYQTIRRHFRRLRSCLDAVTVPRLVVLDAGHHSNMMAERKAPTQDGGDNTRGEPAGLMTDSGDEEGGGGQRDDGRYASDIRVTGLRDWSNCAFGDPLMAMVFSEEPSREFLEGFNGRRRHSGDDGACDMLTMCGDVVEYPEEAHIRILLYQCYHATVAVVKEFYRPQSDSTNRELAARKRLQAVLARLEDIEDDPKRQHVRPLGEMSPAKKPKTEEENGNDSDEESPS